MFVWVCGSVLSVRSWFRINNVTMGCTPYTLHRPRRCRFPHRRRPRPHHRLLCRRPHRVARVTCAMGVMLTHTRVQNSDIAYVMCVWCVRVCVYACAYVVPYLSRVSTSARTGTADVGVFRGLVVFTAMAAIRLSVGLRLGRSGPLYRKQHPLWFKQSSTHCG